MIFGIVKFFVKLFIGTFLGIGLFALLVFGTIKAIRENSNPNDNMTLCINEYNGARVQPNGTILKCPMCTKNFTKRNGKNFCSKECEDEYVLLKDAWDRGDIATITSHGKNCR